MAGQFSTEAFAERSNADILNAVRNEATSDYRSRIPIATDANIENLLTQIMDFPAYRNEFVNALVNRIGLTWSKGVSFQNPLAKFKRAQMAYGASIEEVQVGLVKAKLYDPNRQYLEREIFGNHPIDVQSNFHTVNRKNYYPITINRVELRKAFLEEGGLASFIGQIMGAPTTSDQVDEYLLMSGLFRKYWERDGFFRVRVPDVAAIDSDSPEARSALRAVRQMTDTLPFVSTNYNAAHMPMTANRDDLELFVTPEFNAGVDVNALAAAFNVGSTNIATRQTVVRQEDMRIPGAQAVLTTRDFFVVADTVYESTNMPNPVGLTENYFLHRQQIISASRFVPAILFTSSEDTTPITLYDPVISSLGTITVTDRTGATVPTTNLPRGDYYQVVAEPTVDPAGEPAPVVLTLAGATSSYTRLNQNGTMFVGFDEAATALTITQTDPNNTTSTASKSYTLSGDVVSAWPGQPDAPEADGESTEPTA